MAKASKSQEPKQEQKLFPFFFPDINNGITIMATDAKDAERRLVKLLNS